MDPSPSTLKALAAVSGNICAFPNCVAPIYDTQHGTLVGKACHIKGKKPGSARYDENQSDQERNGFDNLLYMCSAHHDVVDDKKQVHVYTVEVLRKYKRDHEFRYSNTIVTEDVLVRLVRKVLELQKDETSTSERPRVVVTRAIAEPFVVGKRKCGALHIKNSGKATAYNFRLWGHHGLVSADFAGPLKFEYSEPDTRLEIEPDATFTLFGYSDQPLTQAEFKALKQGTKLWFFYAKGTYEDAQGTLYPIECCFQHDARIGLDMRVCADRYWPHGWRKRPVAVVARPEICLADATARCEAGKRPQVIMGLKNTGQLTAHQIEMEGTYYFAHARTFKGPLRHIPNTPPNFFPQLPPGEEAEGRTEDGKPFTERDVKDIETGRLLFLFYAKGSFQDENTNHYLFAFCLMYEPGRPLMKFAPKAFWPART